jgi:hypothetical protein
MTNILHTLSTFYAVVQDFGLARCLDDGNPRMISGDVKDRE